jgi:hypothetical protein
METLVKENFNKMYVFTQSPIYYETSLRIIMGEYKKKFCVPIVTIIWEDRKKSLSNFEFIKEDLLNCNFDFVYYRLSINKNHANYLLFSKKDRIVIRYEPHGILNFNIPLDTELAYLASSLKYTYVSPDAECPYVGVQANSREMFGLCQTAVLYSLLTRLDPVKYNYKPVQYQTPEASRRRLDNTAIMFLTTIGAYFDFNNASPVIRQMVIDKLKELIN